MGRRGLIGENPTVCCAYNRLWDYLRQGNGEHCPSYPDCAIRKSGAWCVDDNIERISELQSVRQVNPKDYDFIESGACSDIFNMVETLSRHYLKTAGVSSPPVPTDIISMINEGNIVVQTLPLKKCNASLVYFDNKWFIFLNAKDGSNLKRFALFHEAFHILAHCKTTPIFKKIGASKGYFNEFLADVFAGSILAPNDWVAEKWSDVRDTKKMAEIFKVPESFIWIRLRRLGLI